MSIMREQSGQQSRAFGRTIAALVLGLAVTIFLPVQAEAPAGARTSDVRILIDISGSMRDTDPQNRRTPSLNLLIDAIPEDATAGIWSFGRYVNLLVPHDPVTGAWRALAQSRVGSLQAIAQRTNLGAALDGAAYDFGYSSYQPPTDVILITDGQVDIAPNVSVNRVERDRILDTVIPRFAAAGARIHTLALGNAADAGLLEQMASQTGGVFAQVREPADMQSFIVRVLSDLSPGNELPFDGREFAVDEQVTELTALVIHEQGQVELLQPDETLTSADDPAEQRWRKGEGYTLITIDDPMAGRWQVLGDISDESRIQVVSDVNLFWIHPTGSVVLRGQPLDLELGVADASGQAIPGALVEVLAPTLRINGELVDGLRWDGRQLRAQVPNRYGDADIEIDVTLDSGTFQRQIRKTVENRPALLSEVLVTDRGIQWRLYPSNRALEFDQVRLNARIDGPASSVNALQLHPTGYFYLDLPDNLPNGDYSLTLTGDARINGRTVTSFGVAPVTLTLPVPAIMPRILNPDALPAEPVMEPETAFVKEPMPEFAEISAQTPVEPAPVVEAPIESEPIPWIRYLLFSLPGLLILFGFFLIYRRLDQRSKGETEDLLAEDRGMADEAMTELEGLDISSDLDETNLDDGGDDNAYQRPTNDQEAPMIDDVFEVEEPEPSPPERTEAPRVSMEDSLDTRSLDEEKDVWGDLDSEGDSLDSLDAGEDDDLFDISNLEDGLSDLENLNLDEDDPFRDEDDDTPQR
jgi:Mg-chelatase subunit ChlD